MKKAIIHFAHANGVPAAVYRKLFHALADDFDVIATPCLGTDGRYPIDNHWRSLTQQVIDYIVQHAQGRPVIGIGHSLGGVLSFQAAQQRPELFAQVIMLDPPLIMGRDCLAMHIIKSLGMRDTLDKMSPAGLSKRRRDHWESSEQAAELLRPKGFYADFDADCFQDYIEHALMPDLQRGGVELRIPKQAEVDIFRTNPSCWWLAQPKAKVPMHLIAASKGPFLARAYPQKIERKFAVPFSVWQGGHMFPLEQPLELAARLKALIQTY